MLTNFRDYLGWACKEFGEQVKKLVNENNKKIEKTEKFQVLKSVYGEEIFKNKVDKLSKSFKDLENLQDGIAISTPVFDGARKKCNRNVGASKLPGQDKLICGTKNW